jgi:hypothetical protein
MTPPSPSSWVKNVGLRAATGPIRNIVNGMWAAFITVRSCGSWSRPSSMVKNATGALIGSRKKIGAVAPAGSAIRTGAGAVPK